MISHYRDFRYRPSFSDLTDRPRAAHGLLWNSRMQTFFAGRTGRAKNVRRLPKTGRRAHCKRMIVMRNRGADTEERAAACSPPAGSTPLRGQRKAAERRRPRMGRRRCRSAGCAIARTAGPAPSAARALPRVADASTSVDGAWPALAPTCRVATALTRSRCRCDEVVGSASFTLALVHLARCGR